MFWWGTCPDSSKIRSNFGRKILANQSPRRASESSGPKRTWTIQAKISCGSQDNANILEGWPASLANNRKHKTEVCKTVVTAANVGTERVCVRKITLNARGRPRLGERNTCRNVGRFQRFTRNILQSLVLNKVVQTGLLGIVSHQWPTN